MTLSKQFYAGRLKGELGIVKKVLDLVDIGPASCLSDLN
jgi:hypothetical protein